MVITMENGNYYIIYGYIGVMMEFYWDNGDNGKENGNYYKR